MDHRVTVGAHDGEFVQFDQMSFRGRIAQRLEVMDVSKIFSELTIFRCKIEPAARNITL